MNKQEALTELNNMYIEQEALETEQLELIAKMEELRARVFFLRKLTNPSLH